MLHERIPEFRREDAERVGMFSEIRDVAVGVDARSAGDVEG